MTQTLDAQVRHLLRHLNDSAALRKNALVTSLFSQGATRSRRDDRFVVERIREMVLGVSRRMLDEPQLGSRAQRWHAIIARCDIGGELHKCVADELAIGMRQFYRERKLAREYLARELQREIPRTGAARATVRADIFSLEFGSIAALRNAGQSALAAMRAQSMFEHGGSPAQRIAAATFAAEVRADLNEHDAAAVMVDDARRMLVQITVPEEQRAECVLRIDAAQARLYWDAGKTAEAHALDASLMERFEREVSGAGHSWKEFALDSVFRIGWRELSAGRLEQATRGVDTADLIARDLDDASAHARAMSLISAGTIRNIRNQDSVTGALFFEALQLCERNGLSEGAIRALIALSVCQQMLGNLPAALETVRGIAERAHEMCSPVTYGLYCLRLAEVSAAAGDHVTAVTSAERAAENIGGVRFVQLVAHLVGAEARLAQGAYSLALASASLAEREAEAQSNARMLGTAYRTIAEALHGLGKTEQAKEYAAASVTMLERSGHPFSLRRAYLSSAKITGKRAHKMNAHHIAGDLIRNKS